MSDFIEPRSEQLSVRQDGAHGTAPRRLSNYIEVCLRERIFSGDWPAGHKLPSEASLRSEFGASRTAVREAIRSLQGSGLLTTINGSGSFVASGALENVARALNAYSTLSLDQQSFSDLIELRMAIEGDVAASLAAARLPEHWSCIEAQLAAMSRTTVLEEFAIRDIDFHMELLKLSGNALFASLGMALRNRYIRYSIDSYCEGESARERTQLEHAEIASAIRGGDVAGAREAARRHVRHARTRWEGTQGGRKTNRGAT